MLLIAFLHKNNKTIESSNREIFKLRNGNIALYLELLPFCQMLILASLGST